MAINSADQKKIDSFIDLLIDWNKKVNLISRKQGDDGIRLQVEDCIFAEAKLPPAKNIIDLGSGPGLPAVVLAILRPASRVIAIESRKKPVNFIEEAISKLALDNLTVFNRRIEDLQFADLNISGSCITVSRAFSPVDELLKRAFELLGKKGRLYYLGGTNSQFWQGRHNLVSQQNYHPDHPNKQLYEITFR